MLAWKIALWAQSSSVICSVMLAPFAFLVLVAEILSKGALCLVIVASLEISALRAELCAALSP